MRRSRLVVVALATVALLAGVAAPAASYPVIAGEVSVDPDTTCTGQALEFEILNNVGTGNWTVFWVTGENDSFGSPTPVPQPAWDNFGPGVSGAGIGGTFPVGSTIAFYYSIGDEAQTPANTGEWLAVFVCGADPGSAEVLDTCYGPAGTCPQSLEEWEASQVDPEPEPEPDPNPGTPSLNPDGTAPDQASRAAAAIAASPRFTG